LEPEALFRGRQPLDLMPGAKSLIIASVYIGGFDAVISTGLPRSTAFR